MKKTATLQRDTIHDLLNISHIRGRCLQLGYEICLDYDGAYRLSSVETGINKYFDSEEAVIEFLNTNLIRRE